MVLAMSTAIAHATDAMVVLSLSPQRVAPGSPVAMLSSVEAKGALTRVSCPADANNAAADLLVVSLPDLDLLMDSQCLVRPQDSGS